MARVPGRDLRDLLADEPKVPEVPARAKAPEPSLDANRPPAESELTPDQRKIRELEHRLAQQDTRKFEAAPEVLDERSENADGSNTILIHVLQDGFTACDRVWYRGQEIEFEIGSVAYEQTKDRNGQSWLDFDDAEQMRRRGDVAFRRGPWPGAKWSDEASEKAERARGRRAPVIR